MKKTKRRDQQEVLRDMFAALALCNNVTPVAEEEKLDDNRATFAHVDANRNSMVRRPSMVEYA